MKRSYRRFIPVAALLTLAVASSAPAATIDLFSSTADGLPYVLTRNTVGSLQGVQTGLADVIGGARDLVVAASSMALPGIDTVQAGVYPAAGVFDYSSSAGADGSLHLLYDANGAGLNADLSGDVFLAVDFTHFDMAGGEPMVVVVAIESGLGSSLQFQTLTAPGPQTLTFPYADFVPSGQLDLASVQSIFVGFEPYQAVDFRLDAIRTEVPEPGSFLLLAAAAGLALRRKRP